MDLLRSNMSMDIIAAKASGLATHVADSCLTQLSYESGMAFSDGWAMNTRSKLEWDEAGNVQQDNSSSSEQTLAAALQNRAGSASGMKRKAGSPDEGRSKEFINRRDGKVGDNAQPASPSVFPALIISSSFGHSLQFNVTHSFLDGAGFAE